MQNFKQLSSQEQYDEFTKFEIKMQKFMDEDVYPHLNLSVDRRGADWHKDLIVRDEKGRSFKVEEKFRTRVWHDFAIELLQDARYSYPLKTGQLGWFYTSRSDWIIQGMARDMRADTLNQVWKVDLKLLRSKFVWMVDNGFNHRQIQSKKGKGCSFNIAFDWSDLQLAGIAERIYYG